MDIEPIHRCAVGIDVHLKNMEVCVITVDEAGEQHLYQRSFGGFHRDRREMAKWISEFEPDIVVMESTGIYWKSPYAALERVGIREHIISAKMIRRHIESMEDDLAELEAHLSRGLQPYEAALSLLLTIPGIDRLGAMKLVVEIGTDMIAFGKPERLAKWAGVCPGNNESAGKTKSSTTTKANRYVRSLLCQLAWAASRTTSQFKSRYRSLATRRGTKRAIMAIAHKLLKTVFIILDRKTPYRDSTVDYEKLATKRNAPRWIRQLKKYGLLQAQSRNTTESADSATPPPAGAVA